MRLGDNAVFSDTISESVKKEIESDTLNWEEKNSRTKFKDYFAKEFVIFHNGSMYQLNYTDFWTISPASVFVNIKSSSVPTLKHFAQEAYNKYLESKNKDICL